MMPEVEVYCPKGHRLEQAVNADILLCDCGFGVTGVELQHNFGRQYQTMINDGVLGRFGYEYAKNTTGEAW